MRAKVVGGVVAAEVPGLQALLWVLALGALEVRGRM